MSDIRNRRLLYFKGFLMLAVGLIGSTILILEHPTLRFVALLSITMWGFCRAYYFAFYVIQHYVDPGYSFAGLIDFLRYVFSKQVSSR